MQPEEGVSYMLQVADEIMTHQLNMSRVSATQHERALQLSREANSRADNYLLDVRKSEMLDTLAKSLLERQGLQKAAEEALGSK